MKIEFDQNKDAVNREKHGVSLEDAVELEWDYLLAERDNRGREFKFQVQPVG